MSGCATFRERYSPSAVECCASCHDDSDNGFDDLPHLMPDIHQTDAAYMVCCQLYNWWMRQARLASRGGEEEKR